MPQTLAQGTILYHGTTYESVNAMLKDGLKVVSSAWGDTELGPGFYTATTLQGGAAYLSGAGAVLEFTTQARMAGEAVTPPAKFDWSARTSELDGLLKDHDYLVNAQDTPVSQYKFNPSGIPRLKVTGVYLLENSTWKRYSLQDYQDLF